MISSAPTYVADLKDEGYEKVYLKTQGCAIKHMDEAIRNLYGDET